MTDCFGPVRLLSCCGRCKNKIGGRRDMRTKLRNWFYCLWNGHQFKETDRHEFGNGDLWIRKHCRVCGEVDITFLKGNK